MIKAIDFTNYSGTYYVQIKEDNGKITTHEKITANSPIEAARLFKASAKPCKKEHGTIYVISNKWRFGEKARNNYYN